jgi:hypothetical protein
MKKDAASPVCSALARIPPAPKATMENAAPNAAAWLIPRVNGEAKGFPRRFLSPQQASF